FIEDIENLENNPLNISFGDVLNVLNSYKIATYDLEDLYFIFAIKSYYTIELTSLYSKYKNGAEKLIGTDIYPRNAKITYNLKHNNFWTFEFDNISDSKISVNELVATFVISMRKDIERTNDEVIYEYQAVRKNNQIIFSLLGFIRNIFFYQTHFKRVFGEETKSNFNFENPIIPFFSVDLLEVILNDLIFNKVKFSSSYRFDEIIYRQIIGKIQKKLSEVDKTLATKEVSLEEKFSQHPFIKAITEEFENSFSEKINLLHPSATDLESESVQDSQKEDLLKRLAKHNLNYYKGRYFSGREFSPQGAKRAMNNLAKDFKDFPSEQNYLWKLRGLMDRNILEALKRIEEFLRKLANGQS
ncbi:hypothetical protein KAOT1_05912, partial [Kordia algicida OT-1]